MPFHVDLLLDPIARAHLDALEFLRQEDERTVLLAALTTGLDRWTRHAQDFPPGPTFTPKPEPNAKAVTVAIGDADIARAAIMAVTVGAEIVHVIGCALCTGLASLAGHGSNEVRGPFRRPAPTMAEPLPELADEEDDTDPEAEAPMGATSAD